jgi:alkanesulfonate monooxygenase SsuD/methylene tetrahydromethanopterin reductase-like flavin-dependent oxidoreductase (luciferase family)
MTRAYASRVGLMADAPNFPAAWDEVIEKVKIADELGFDSIWLGESWGYELFTSMADLVRATKRIKIGAGIANIYSRSPALIASSVATLDERSGGRILLGLGPSSSYVIEHWHGVPFQKPVQRTREYVEIIRMILRGQKLVYHGEFFNLERGFTMRFKTMRKEIPIYIAAMGPKNILQAGEISDGVLPVYWPANKWGELREQLDEGAKLAGHPPHSAAIAPYLTCFILDDNATEEDRREARFKAAMPLVYYIGRMGVFYAQMLARNGYGREVEAVQEGWKRGMQGAVEALSPELLDITSLVGTPQEIVARLDTWVAAGVDEPILSMPPGPPDMAGPQLERLMQALKE